MIITNKYNLPEPFYKALSWTKEPTPGVFYVTEIIDAPLISFLRRKHWHELTEDISTMLWKLLGDGVHLVLAKHAPASAFSEERMVLTMQDLVDATDTLNVDGVKIVGRADLWHDGVIVDYKVTSVYSFLLGEKDVWETQLQVYAKMYSDAGFPAKSLQIHAILRDWMESKAAMEDDYPPIPFVQKEFKPWEEGKIQKYLRDRLELFKGVPRPCTLEERWGRPTTYAVKQKLTDKRAKRVLSTSESAFEWARNNMKGDFEIEVREGANVRCDRFCAVRDFCPYKQGNA